MTRAAIAVILAVAALAMLISLVWQSRSLPINVHLAQNTISTELQRVAEDFTTLVATLQSEWAATQTPGEGARASNVRLTTSPDNLKGMIGQIPGSSTERVRLLNTFETFSRQIAEADELTRQIFDEQSAYVADVEFVRNEGPRVIQQMRDLQLDGPAADAFQLVVGTLDFATPRGSVQEFELRRLLTTLRRDQRVDANMPREVERLRVSVAAILDGKRLLQSKLDQLAGIPIPAQADVLAFASQDVYQGVVASGDQARLILSIYSIALLAAVGFVAFRLQSSYRQINRTNAELAELNESLEQRVANRTEELAGTLRDLKESQVQLVQAEKMSSLGQLVAGISHEINTPLLYLANNAVLIQERLQLLQKFVRRCSNAFAVDAGEFQDRAEFQKRFLAGLKDVKGMLSRDELEATVQEAQDLAQDSIEGLQDLTEIAQSLKDFSRLDRAPIASFDINSGLDKTLLIARNIIKHKAEVRKFYGDLPEIECSPSQINQVFLNLITNAAQAIADQGEIVITTKCQGNDHIAVSVADTGCGIPESIMHKVRDPFFTTKEVGSGTGLGLSIVDEIIRSHDGRLEIGSKVGRGSVFTVILPITQSRKTGDDELLADLAALDPLEVEERRDQSDKELAEAV